MIWHNSHGPASPPHRQILMCGHSHHTARTLRAKALADDAVQRCSPQVKAPPGLLMPLRSHASTTRLPVRVDRCALNNEHVTILSD